MQFGPAITVGVDADTDPDGWIQVPRQNSLVIGGVGRFAPTGVLAQLDTTKLTNEVFDLTPAVPPLPLKAGDPMPAAQKSVKPVFKINFEARKVIGHAGVNANSLAKLRSATRPTLTIAIPTGQALRRRSPRFR